MARVTAETDTEYEDKRLTSVQASGDGYYITSEAGWCFYCPGGVVEPKVGDTARYYGRGIGFPVRGLAINGVTVFYQTPAEFEAAEQEKFRRWDEEKRQKFEEHRAEHDERITALPEVFRRRLARFQQNNPAFRWQHEEYELFCCEQAIAIASHLPTRDEILFFNGLDFDAQKEKVPELSDGHSGNTFGASVRLAIHYVTEPENVVREHGAHCPMLGCREYGCVPPRATGYPE